MGNYPDPEGVDDYIQPSPAEIARDELTPEEFAEWEEQTGRRRRRWR